MKLGDLYITIRLDLSEWRHGLYRYGIHWLLEHPLRWPHDD